ncbi:MAG: hypothetical protein ACRC0G_15465 [Fusobacteriaceae bacterium]
MRVYGNTYHGRVYTFKVTDIRKLDTGEVIVWITNQENYRESKLNPSYIINPCGEVWIGDTITRQYTREGMGLYGGMGGGYSSQGTTEYFNETSQERYKVEHPMETGVAIWLIIIIFIITLFLLASI